MVGHKEASGKTTKRSYEKRAWHPSQCLRNVRRTQKLGQDRLIILLDKKGTVIHDQDKIIERIEKFYTELNDSEQSTIIHTDPKDIPAITSWEVKAAPRDMKNGISTGNDHINIETLKAGDDTISERRRMIRR